MTGRVHSATRGLRNLCIGRARARLWESFIAIHARDYLVIDGTSATARLADGTNNSLQSVSSPGWMARGLWKSIGVEY